MARDIATGNRKGHAGKGNEVAMEGMIEGTPETRRDAWGCEKIYRDEKLKKGWVSTE